ncbi:MAG: NADH-quinone oxidoreductase subunit 5 family protein [Chloroflexota bacterium]
MLAWACIFTLPGLFIGSLGWTKPGRFSVLGPAALLACSIAWLLGGRETLVIRLNDWLPFVSDGAFELRVDALAVLMLGILGIVALCVYVYTLAYMADDPGIRRFYAFLDFFVASMALLVTAGNLAVLLIGWTGVGMASYFLISFWRDRDGTLYAGLQAIAANAVGDGALILAAVLIPAGCGNLTTLQAAGCTSGVGGAALIGGLLVVAASAKSAQGPLYFWLPSAMAGPTPISALIHAATMVAAGVYLLVRVHLLLALTPLLLLAIAILGVATAIFGAVMSLLQSNLKKGLAYSTISQLGYMFAAVGFSAPFAAFFHLGSQAFFKALLFLSAGVVIHAIGGSEELSSMGGLGRQLPFARWTFLIGSISLFGLPFTAGFFSKDAIVEASGGRLLGWALVATALLSGMYIGRLYFATFEGPRRSQDHLHEPREPHAMAWSLLPLAAGALLFGYTQWPEGGLARALGPLLGAVETQPLFTVQGGLAVLLGVVGFVGAGLWSMRQAMPERAPGSGWVRWASDASLALAGGFASAQNGRLGRYAVITVLGFAAILFAGLRA